MNALERIFEVLRDFLPESSAPDADEALDFDTEIWRAFFDTLFMAVSSSALARWQAAGAASPAAMIGCPVTNARTADVSPSPVLSAMLMPPVLL